MGHYHIEAKPGDIAEYVLLPGDPLRAKFIAETFLEDVFCYNQVRGMHGYTGTYKGRHRFGKQYRGCPKPASTTMSCQCIWSKKTGARRKLRSLQEHVKLYDVIAGGAPATKMVRRRFFGHNAPTAV